MTVAAVRDILHRSRSIITGALARRWHQLAGVAAVAAATVVLFACPLWAQQPEPAAKTSRSLTAAVPAAPASTTEHLAASASVQPDQDNEQPAELYVQVRIPHNREVSDSLTAYPYPVKPPRLLSMPRKLPTKDKDLKGMLVNYGYTNRFGKNKKYVPNGWRWQYAYEAALRRKGDLPHTIFEIYPWADEMIRYIKPEIQRINNLEDLRVTRYASMLHEYEKTYLEIQNDATRKGLFAVDLRLYRQGQAYAKLAAGTWWIVVTRKAPSLVYYWQVPVTLAPGATEHVELNEGNALLVQGNW